jgi:membrane associated rhomboid family serine protease
MGIQDRDYYRQPAGGGSFANFRAWSVTNWLIAINVAVFLIGGPLNQACALSLNTIDHLQLWRIITFQFLHANFWHILGNMFFLFSFGGMVEPYLGARRFLAFYLICGIGGGLIFLLLGAVGLVLPNTVLVGASAGIFGVIVAAMRLTPATRIRMLVMMLFPIDLTVLQLGWIAIGLSAYVMLKDGDAGQASHFGGIVVGYFLIRHENLLNFVYRKSRMRYGGKRIPYRDWNRKY